RVGAAALPRDRADGRRSRARGSSLRVAAATTDRAHARHGHRRYRRCCRRRQKTVGDRRELQAPMERWWVGELEKGERTPQFSNSRTYQLTNYPCALVSFVSASFAASCSASFLLAPVASASTSPRTDTST